MMFQYENLSPPAYLEQIIDNRASTAFLKYKAYEYMREVNAWCSRPKASILIDLIQRHTPEVIVEIGVWSGGSLIPMAHALRANGKGKIYGIDPWSNYESIQGLMSEANLAYWKWVDHEAVMQTLIANIADFGLQDQIELIRSSSLDAPPIPNIDILHIDGNHSEHTSYIDVTKWVPLVKKGGWIIVDDISWYENGFTQTKSVEWLDRNCLRIAEINDVSIWGIWVKL